MCNVQVLIINGLLHVSKANGEVQEETLTYEFVPVLLSLFILYSRTPERRARKEYQVFQKLLQMIPCLFEHLTEASDEESMMVAGLVCPTINLKYLSHEFYRFRRASLLPDPMIRRA